MVPSEALQARADAQSTLTALFLGLGAVALLVGGVGIARCLGALVGLHPALRAARLAPAVALRSVWPAELCGSRCARIGYHLLDATRV